MRRNIEGLDEEKKEDRESAENIRGLRAIASVLLAECQLEFALNERGNVQRGDSRRNWRKRNSKSLAASSPRSAPVSNSLELSQTALI